MIRLSGVFESFWAIGSRTAAAFPSLGRKLQARDLITAETAAERRHRPRACRPAGAWCPSCVPNLGFTPQANKFHRSAVKRPSGLSLLEVVLAMTIFGLAMATLGELVRLGMRSAADARDLTTAQLYAESLVAEIAAGVRGADPVPVGTQVEYDPNWLYSVQLEAAEQPGLVAVIVTVESGTDTNARRATFSLRRWIQDPGLELTPTEDEMSESETEASSSNAGSPAGGASG